VKYAISTTPSGSGGAVKAHVPIMICCALFTPRYPVQGLVAPVLWSIATVCRPTVRRRSGSTPSVRVCSTAKAAGSSAALAQAVRSRTSNAISAIGRC
jgi:hypothetical protein